MTLPDKAVIICSGVGVVGEGVTAEEKLAALIWRDAPPILSELVALADKEMDWKRSTTYTLLKKTLFRRVAAEIHHIIYRRRKVGIGTIGGIKASPIKEYEESGSND